MPTYFQNFFSFFLFLKIQPTIEVTFGARLLKILYVYAGPNAEEALVQELRGDKEAVTLHSSPGLWSGHA